MEILMKVNWNGWREPERRFYVQVEDSERILLHEYFSSYAEAVRQGEIALNQGIEALEAQKQE